ncbi:MAG: FUN14 domain-containing protein [Cocleimonas sp.]|nr:FUN14 domain-containing protein [Cocleimonas sp.]
MNDDTSSFLLTTVGAPFAIGLAVGYFAKKALKLVLFIAGAAIIALFVAEYNGHNMVDNESLKNMADTATSGAKQSGDFLMDRLSNIGGQGISATAGFLAGLKLG